MEKVLTIENIKGTQKLGVAIKRFRKAKGMSQTELADVMGMRQATISDIENGRGTLDSFFKIIHTLGLNLVLSNKPNFKEGKAQSNELIDLLEG